MTPKNSLSQKDRTKAMIMTSMLAALVFAVTYFIPPVPIPNSVGYVNLGDSVIYCSAMLIGAPWSAAAAGIGSLLADWAYGAVFFMPGTLIIKGLMGFVCAIIIKNTTSFKRFIIACIIGGAIMVLGYAVYEWAVVGVTAGWVIGWTKAITALPFNLMQWAGGVTTAVVLFYPIKRIKLALK